MRSLLPWLTALLVVAADRATKLWVLEHLSPGSWTPVLPGLALTHVHNRGIAFSLFADGGWLSRIVLHAVILIAITVIAAMAARHGRHRRVAGLAFGLILGGALGNLVDRILYGWVIDFVHVWVRIGERAWSWPDFNVADSAITIGAVLLIVEELWRPRTAEKHAPDTD